MPLQSFFILRALHTLVMCLHRNVYSLAPNIHFWPYQLEKMEHSTRNFFLSLSTERSIFCPFPSTKLHLPRWIHTTKMFEYSKCCAFLCAPKIFSSTSRQISLCGLVTSRITSNIMLEKKEKKKEYSVYICFFIILNIVRSYYQLPNFEHNRIKLTIEQFFNTKLSKAFKESQMFISATDTLRIITEKFTRRFVIKPYWLQTISFLKKNLKYKLIYFCDSGFP